MEKDEKRALFLSGAGTLTYAELHEWSEEVKPGIWDSIPQSELDPDTPLYIVVMGGRSYRQ